MTEFELMHKVNQKRMKAFIEMYTLYMKGETKTVKYAWKKLKYDFTNAVSESIVETIANK